MTNKSGNIGTWTAERVVRYLRANGFPTAERTALHGANDIGDITGTPGVVWEVKGGAKAETASDGQVALWLLETERERKAAGADIGVLVMKRKGLGERQAGNWWAVVFIPELAFPGWRREPRPGHYGHVAARLYLDDAIDLLRRHGYGEPYAEAEAPPHAHMPGEIASSACPQCRALVGSAS